MSARKVPENAHLDTEDVRPRGAGKRERDPEAIFAHVAAPFEARRARFSIGEDEHAALHLVAQDGLRVCQLFGRHDAVAIPVHSPQVHRVGLREDDEGSDRTVSLEREVALREPYGVGARPFNVEDRCGEPRKGSARSRHTRSQS